jgi:MYXO-CTERM domain-containing protein
MYYENGQGGSTYDLPDLEVIVEGDTITFRVPSRELRSAGVAPVSGFGVYAYAHTLTIREDGDYRVRVNWDAAGVGAAGVPAEFSNEPEEESPLPPFLAPMAIALVAVALLALAGRRRR